MRKIQYIACVNNGAYIMNFSVQWLTIDGTWSTSEWNSGNYPINQTRKSPDLRSIGVPADALAVTPLVQAVAGVSAQGAPFGLYEANGQTTTYSATGTTLDVRVQQI